VPADQLEAHQKRGYMVVKPDEKNVAQFVRFHKSEALNDEEKLLHFHRQNGVRIVPDSFLFQEGHAKYYEEAKYGVFKFDNNGNHLLTGMADEDGHVIIVSE
jgi:uncharacterized membrane-anchored protein